MSTIESIFGKTTIMPDHSPYFKAMMTKPKSKDQDGTPANTDNLIKFNTVFASNIPGVILKPDGTIDLMAGKYLVMFSWVLERSKYGAIWATDSAGNEVLTGFGGLAETWSHYSTQFMIGNGIVNLSNDDTLKFYSRHTANSAVGMHNSHLDQEVYAEVEIWGLDKPRVRGSLHNAEIGITPLPNDSTVSQGQFWVDSSDNFKLKYKDSSGTSHEVSLS